MKQVERTKGELVLRSVWVFCDWCPPSVFRRNENFSLVKRKTDSKNLINLH